MRPHRFRRSHRRRFRIVASIFATLFFGSVILVVAGGALLVRAHGDPGLGAMMLTASAVLMWLLAAFVFLRILRPIGQLARVAGALQDGELHRRVDLRGGGDDIGQVADALKSMAHRVEQQLDDQRGLMAAVSHELRSPLARLRVMIELSRDGLGPDDLHDQLQREIDGMDELVGDLLATSRIDFSALQPEQLDVAAIVKTAIAQSSAVVHSRLDVPSVFADPTLLTRALHVLLENAHHHGGTEVDLRARRVEQEIWFEVVDGGPGFRPGEEEQAFQPFWRRPGESAAGVGLGLSLVRRIAQAHDGRAFAESRAEGGARVVLTLPVR